MESVPGAGASGSGEGPSSSSSPAAPTGDLPQLPPASSSQPPSRYESQKRRDWNTFLQYLKNHKPPLTLARCSGAHVIEFLKYLDQFGKTKVHAPGCAFFGHPNPPSPCACPLRQAWGSLDALIGRLRAAYEESGGRPESNPFGARAVRIYLREIRESQAKARGIPYEKKKRKRSSGAGGSASMSAASGASSSSSGPSATGVSTAPAIIIPSSVAGPSGSTAPPVRMPLTSSGSAAQRGPVGASTPHGGSTSGTT